MIINSVFGLMDDYGIPVISGDLLPCLVVCLKRPPDSVFKQKGLFPFYLQIENREDLFNCMEQVDCIILTDNENTASILQEYSRYFLFWDWSNKMLVSR